MTQERDVGPDVIGPALEWFEAGLARLARETEPEASIVAGAEWLPDRDEWRLLVSLRARAGRAHAFVRIAPGTDAEAAVAQVAPKLPDLFRMAAGGRR